MNEWKPAHRDARGLPSVLMCVFILCLGFSCFGFPLWEKKKPAHRGSRGLPTRMMNKKNRYTEALGDYHRASKVRKFGWHCRYSFGDSTDIHPRLQTLQITTFGLNGSGFNFYFRYLWNMFPSPSVIAMQVFRFGLILCKRWWPTLRLSCCPHSGFMASKSKAWNCEKHEKPLRKWGSREPKLLFMANP